jgi:hypothetical protein
MTAIDWSQYPRPWNEIGPAFAREVAAIVNGAPLPFITQRPTINAWAELRVKAGLTQRQLAARAGCCVDTISRIERGYKATPWLTARLGGILGA